MKILFLNTFDQKGGAARAAYRLHQGLRASGIDSQMLVRGKESDNGSVISATRNASITQRLAYVLAPQAERLALRRYPKRKDDPFSVNLYPNRIAQQVRTLKPDLIHMTWTQSNFVPVQALKHFHRPILWRLPDMWAFTGGCHYAGECDGYLKQCGCCPLLGSNREDDLSRTVWTRKAQHWRDLNLTIVTPSRWLAECARSSSLFQNRRVEVIPNGLDLSRYRPLNREFARQALGLPQDRKLIVFGAIKSLDDPRKGSGFLIEALQRLSAVWSNHAEVVIFGANPPDNPPQMGFEAHYTGHLYDDISLALLYSAADVTVVPSVQEAFGQTASESLACGTPVVAFAATGLLDIVDHQQNGYLARAFEVDDLAAGIAWVLEDDDRRARLSRQARLKAETQFEIGAVARRYADLYREILER
ncbi:MAG: glycosyltransferase family 4 protein [bacterium]|nr:glycosyltransferase family 4 protein [bacterium]